MLLLGFQGSGVRVKEWTATPQASFCTRRAVPARHIVGSQGAVANRADRRVYPGGRLYAGGSAGDVPILRPTNHLPSIQPHVQVGMHL